MEREDDGFLPSEIGEADPVASVGRKIESGRLLSYVCWHFAPPFGALPLYPGAALRAARLGYDSGALLRGGGRFGGYHREWSVSSGRRLHPSGEVSMPRVSLVKSSESYDAVSRALSLIKNDVKVPDRPVLVKPNMVSANVDLCATPVEAIRAVLDFLKELGVRRFVVGEATTGDTMAAFKRYGYTSLPDDYDVQLVDLRKDEAVDAIAYDADCKPMTLQVSRTVVDSYRVSVARMKTHNRTFATLAVKNLAVGSIIPNRSKFCHVYRAINLTLARMNMERPPDLSVTDGVVGMEGSGPVNGTAKHSGVALAGIDSTAVDAVGAQVMGYDPEMIGHLYYQMELEGLAPGDIEVVGEKVADCVTRYKDHPEYEAQLDWRVDGWRGILGGAAQVR